MSENESNAVTETADEQIAIGLRSGNDKKRTWLERNIHPILAIGIILLTFFMYWCVITLKFDTNNAGLREVIIYILGALTAISTQVVSYYFGSSSGSARKSDILDEMAKK